MHHITTIINTESSRTKRGKLAMAIHSYYAGSMRFQRKLRNEEYVDENLVDVPFKPIFDRREKKHFDLVQFLKNLMP